MKIVAGPLSLVGLQTIYRLRHTKTPACLAHQQHLLTTLNQPPSLEVISCVGASRRLTTVGVSSHSGSGEGVNWALTLKPLYL